MFIRREQLVPLTTKKYFITDKTGTSSELINVTRYNVTLWCLINEESWELLRCEILSKWHLICNLLFSVHIMVFLCSKSNTTFIFTTFNSLLYVCCHSCVILIAWVYLARLRSLIVAFNIWNKLCFNTRHMGILVSIFDRLF